MTTLNEKEQIEILLAAFDSSYDGIHILDNKGNTLFINDACVRIEGVTKEQAFSQNIRELVENGVYSESVTLKILKEKRSITMIQKAQNGSHVLVTGTPIYGNGKIEKVIVNSRDITELNLLREELVYLRKNQLDSADIISKNIEMQKIVKLADIVAKVDSTVLITGESGVGKGVISKYIHNNSLNHEGPFIKIDCSAIPESLFESELFGYEKGAFTGAEKNGKVGLLELGNGGTVFFDEIGEMPLNMQAKLLRVMQDKQIIPVGGKTLKKLNIRIIAATNIDLEEMVKEKAFREDLYYRLNVIPIKIPPLRERKEDILPLIQSKSDKINKQYGWEKSFTPSSIKAMINYSWPGNVRELENFIERLLVSFENDIIDISNIANKNILDENYKEVLEQGGSYKELLDKFDLSLITQAIATEGNIPLAAKKLGIDTTTLRRKLKKYEYLS